MLIVEAQEGAPIAPGLPFSFVYEGRPSVELLTGWHCSMGTERLDRGRLAHTLTVADPRKRSWGPVCDPRTAAREAAGLRPSAEAAPCAVSAKCQ